MLSQLNKFIKVNTNIFICFAFCAYAAPLFALENIDSIQTLYDDGKYTETVKQLESIGLTEFTPEHFKLYVYSQANIDLDDAEDAADEAIKMFSDNPEMFLMHADIMGRQAQNSVFSILSYAKKAKVSLETAAKLAPTETKYLQGLMTFYLAAPSIAGDDTEQALVQANAIAALDQELGYSAIASYHWAVDEQDTAIEILKDGLRKYPGSLDLLSQKANFYVSNDQYLDAITTYKMITQQKPVLISMEERKDDELLEGYAQQMVAMLNSHYQIGRVALISESEMDAGIEHLKTYISLYKKADYDLSGLPSLDWAHLRLAGLLFEKGEILLAETTIKQVKQAKVENMESIYKKLDKKIKRAVRKLS